MYFRRKYFLVYVLVFISCLWQGEQENIDNRDIRMTFLHTSDIHSRLFPYHFVPTSTDRSLGLLEGNSPFGGVARLGYLIKRERKRSSRVLHLDSGDVFQGAPIFNENFGEPEFRFLSMVGADAVVLGNHEFDAGVNNLNTQLYEWATFDSLAANYIMPNPDDPNNHILAQLSKPHTIYNLKGLKVAVIGMANLGSLSSIGEGGNSLGITPLEQNETVRSYVQLLHSSVDLIVILSHLGLDEDQQLIQGYTKIVWEDHVKDNWKILENLGDGRVEVFIPGVSDIDLVLGGHLHITLNPPNILKDKDGYDVILAHGGAFAKYLTRLDVVLKDDTEKNGKKIVSHKYQIFPVDNRLAFYEDKDIVEMLLPYSQDLLRNVDLHKVVAYAPRTVLRRSNKGNGDSALGNLLAEAMRRRRRVDAEFSLTNTLGIRENFYQGVITLEEMFNTFPFENSITVMYLSGAEVQELIDFITARSASRGCQSQAQVSGIRFTMNCSQALKNIQEPQNYVSPGEDIIINGRPLNRLGTYKMATNDYIANGGSGFRVLKRNTTKVDTGISLRDALIDYLSTLTTCGEYERDEAHWCDDISDYRSQNICIDVGLEGRVLTQSSSYVGAFAHTPCMIAQEDGRIKRIIGEEDN